MPAAGLRRPGHPA
ncbi:4-hydroxythreonine-4-phosphate dehydrogenase, partial [Stenotrophomonas maltophilia]